MTTSVERPPLVVVDTNVLLAATDTDRLHHQAASTFLRSDVRRLAVTLQIVREYLAVSTRPVEANGLGLEVEQACHNVEEILAAATLLDEGRAATTRLLQLLPEVIASGKQVHDANLVACALVHGAAAIVTDNTRHFSRFASLIRIEDLAQTSPG